MSKENTERKEGDAWNTQDKGYYASRIMINLKMDTQEGRASMMIMAINKKGRHLGTA